MIAIQNLGSGSRGNASLVRSSKTTILVDAGFTCRQLVLRLAACGVEPGDLDAIVISHEHSDHVAGLRVFCKRHGIPVYCTDRTAASKPVLKSELKRIELFDASTPFTIGDLDITPFSIPHDAVDPVAFVIETEGMRIGHCTDMGYPTELAKHHLQNCNFLVLEANHDYQMLIDGPYPWPVKQRIMGRTGHLNNEAAAELLAELYHADLLAVRLAHLSQENNDSELARSQALNAIATKLNGNQVNISVLVQGEPGAAMNY